MFIYIKRAISDFVAATNAVSITVTLTVVAASKQLPVIKKKWLQSAKGMGAVS